VSDPEGLTPDRRLVHHVQNIPWLALIPAPSALWHSALVAGLRRDVHASVFHVAGDRRLEGEPIGGFKIQEARTDR
jgi:hypothetical protein